MSAGRAVLKRLAVALAVVFLVVSTAAVASLLAPAPGGGGIAAAPEQTEWAADRLDPERLENSGEANPKGDVGVVLIDRSHANRFKTEDISPLVAAINAAGGEVRFTDATGDLTPELSNADVLVVIDPDEGYEADEVREIEQFVDDGGRLIMVGEPNRKEIQRTGFFASLVVQRSQLTALASPFGVSYGTHYVYDMQHNAGNFKNVVTSPPSRTDARVVRGVEQVTMYTAATVSVNRGRVLLRTSRTAERGSEDAQEGFPVAVLAADGRVMALGDKTFLNDQYHAVADNDLFIQRIVEFMTRADHQPTRIGVGNETAAPTEPTTAPALD